MPTKFSCTPSYIGGKINRSGPNYGEDTEYVLHTILGRSLADIARLREQVSSDLGATEANRSAVAGERNAVERLALSYYAC